MDIGNLDRRQLLQLSAVVGTGAIAGCIGEEEGETSIDRDEFRLEELEDRFVLSGERMALMSRESVDGSGFDFGQQIRVGEPDRGGIKGDASVFTIRQEYPTDPDLDEVLIGSEYTENIGTSPEGTIVVAPFAPHPDLSTAGAGRSNDEYISQIVDNGEHTDLVAIAPHGGQMETNTARQALRIADRMDITGWVGMAYDSSGEEEAYERWFVPDTNIHVASFPKLATIDARDFEYAVSFHGYHENEPSTDVTVGGLIGGEKRATVRSHIESQLKASGFENPDVSSPSLGSQHATSSENVVNWITRNGRSGVEVLSEYWWEVTDGVMEAFGEILAEDDSDSNNGSDDGFELSIHSTGGL